MNCIDNACKYCKQCYLDDVIWCTLTDTVVPDNIDETQCEKFVQAKTCLDCVHAISKYNCRRCKTYDLELVVFELVEVEDDEDG